MSDMTTPPPEEAEPSAAEPAPTPEAAAPVPAPPPPSAMETRAGGWGPPGKVRSWISVALLGIVTCGVYLWFWAYYVFEEDKQHSGDGIGGVGGVLLQIFIPIVNWFLLPAEIGNLYAKANKPKPVSGVTGFWNLIPIAGYFIWVYKVQTAMNDRWEELGAVRE